MNIKKITTKGLILAIIALPQIMCAMENTTPVVQPIQPTGFWTGVKNVFVCVKNIPSATFNAVKTGSQAVVASTKNVLSGIASCPGKMARGVKNSAVNTFDTVKQHPLYTLIGVGSIAAVSYLAWKHYTTSKESTETPKEEAPVAKIA